MLDTSGSMAGDKIVNARAAIERFLDQLLNPDDEVFLYGFANDVELLQDWTTDREAVSASLRGVRAFGGTAMYDAVVEAVPVAQNGRHRKKAVILISDGNDTNSHADIRDVRRSCARRKCWSTRLASTARKSRRSGHGRRRSRPTTDPVSLPWPRTSAHPVARTAAVPADHRQCRSGSRTQRLGAPRHHGRKRRPDRDRARRRAI